MNTEASKDIITSCPNSKIEIKAENYNKTKTFNIDNGGNQRLSRVDSQNYPDATDNLDCLAQKMGFNHQNNKSTTMKLDHIKSDRNSEEKVNEKELSKSFQISSDKPMQVTPNKISQKKMGFMSNIIRRLSISTPKIFSKNRKHKKPITGSDKESIENPDLVNRNADLLCRDKSNNSDKLTNGIDENHSQFTPRSKTIRKILQKLGKRKGRGNVISEPPSSIDSRPSLSSVVNHGLNIESAISCNDIYLNKLCKMELQKHNSSSADCILDFQKHEKLVNHRKSGSSNSEDLKEHEATLNETDNLNQIDIVDDAFPDLEVSKTQGNRDDLSPISIKTSDFKFDTQRSYHSTMSGGCQTETSHNVKLTLALYGYCNYGLGSSRVTSKSCMDFRPSNTNKKLKLSVENISFDKALKSVECDDKRKSDEESKVNNDIKVENDEGTDHTDKVDNKLSNEETETDKKTEEPAVVLRKSKRPGDIKLRKSREPNPNLVARSSMIMLVVSHNSPRSKVVSNQLTTPNKELDFSASLNGSLQQTTNIPAMKLNFEGLSVNEKEIPTQDEARKSGNLSSSLDASKLNHIIENGFADSNEVLDGHYFLNLVYKNENDIQGKIDQVQNYLDNKELEFDDEVSGQLLVTVGKAKLLLSEKMLQFKGLCEKNISGIIEENELPTLSSDLNGFWDMVFGQIEDINKNFVLVENIRSNGWKMIPYETTEKLAWNTPVRQKRTTTRSSVGQGKNTNTPTPQKKKLSSETPSQNKLSAEKRKNMMLFKLNQKASMVQKSDSNFCDGITFY